MPEKWKKALLLHTLVLMAMLYVDYYFYYFCSTDAKLHIFIFIARTKVSSKTFVVRKIRS